MSESKQLYKKVVFAGTFDHLHEGHKHLLRTALALGEKVGIGLTVDKMLSLKDDREKIQTYDKRRNQLEKFLLEFVPSERFDVFPIETKEGGADKMEDIEALIVSDELSVVETALEINAKRAKNGLKRFHIIVVPRVRTEDSRPMSSSRIRDGESFDSSDLVY
ncbi:MAG: pantetheine-phosphate adenylyltransferase [Candidatus Thorarchaeota archaeon]